MARGSSSLVREGEGNQDLASLHEALEGERDRLASELDQIRAERDAALEQVALSQQEVDALKAKLDRFLRLAYDRSSEKLHPDQLRLFAEKGAAEEGEAADPSPPPPEELAADDESAEEPPPPSKPRKPRKEKQPRLAADAEIEVIEHPVEDMTCACGAEMVSIGVEESEEIEYVPARFKKIIHRRHKAACFDCQENVVRAPAPSRVMWKCLPGVTLATWILVSKYKDHVPLHRLSGIFARLGAQLRYRQSRPALAFLLKFVRQLEKDSRVLPQSALGTAVAYMLRNWRPLRRFTLDGHLEIDNNRVERCIRPVALGRKNWLFAGSERGGRAAACIYSLVESCNLIRVPVERYLKDVLEKLAHDPKVDPASLTPKRWKESASSSDPAPALDFPS
jgi:transposase